jgi:hypothetical protein
MTHRDATERLFKKLFAYQATREKGIGSMIEEFWNEHEMFISKKGAYDLDSQEYIWNAKELKDGNSYLWHKKNSYKYTKYFGHFACIVTSKILGIGAAERSWGNVKDLKNAQRSHLSSDRTKKQATIYGASCSQMAKIRRDISSRNNDDDDGSDGFTFWEEADFDKAFEFNMESLVQDKVTTKPMRILKCFMEEWEVESVGDKSPVMETKLLRKYGGLEFIDIDSDKLFRIDNKNMAWHGKRKKDGDGGWCLIGYREEWTPSDPNRKKYEEPWALFDDCPIHDCLAWYYKKNPHLGVIVIRSDTENIYDDEDSARNNIDSDTSLEE